MISFPNAKINIGLNILSRRPDGYHQIETLFYPIALRDVLEFVPALHGKPSVIAVTGLVPEGDIADNLVFKAYRLLSEGFPIPPLQIHLHKFIPSGAGLGGGSSDAACMINLLAKQFQLPITMEMQMTYAARLGSDCPFFLLNRPALAGGRGELLEPIGLSLSGYHLMLIKPSFSMNTREAYSGVKPHLPVESLRELLSQPISNWNDMIINDFEASVFRRYPEIGQIKNKLIGAGALYASMSGSGSAVYGIFSEKPEEMLFPQSYFIHYEQL